jgi:ADP-heptose:LPS heptosyltransferase
MDWGLCKWSELIRRFREHTNTPGLMIIGSSEDKDRANILIEIWGEGAINCCGGPTPRESAAALSHARLFCGHDSGPLH